MKPENMKNLVDLSKCTGCESCKNACSFGVIGVHVRNLRESQLAYCANNAPLIRF